LASRNEKLEKEKVDQIIFLMEDYSKKNQEREENQGVFDNIYAAMFKILVSHHSKYPQENTLERLKAIFQRVPLKDDKDECLTISEIIVS
jgi:hypothetical protein